uniref:G protein-coupled receptor n=1 Tax=Panagrolaimus superbus TaxID=310955 RepID=A0A914XY34_9BILA
MVISYSLLIYFCIQISRKLNNKNTVMHVKTKLLNKQIHRALIVQAIIPMFACNAPMIILLVITFFGGNSQNTSLFCSSALAWIPAANPLASLFIIRFYRR